MKFEYRLHALQRMFERRISQQEVETAILEGIMVEEYEDDTPYPSYLKCRVENGIVVHVVYAVKDESDYVVITAYRPDPEKWTNEFTQRKI